MVLLEAAPSGDTKCIWAGACGRVCPVRTPRQGSGCGRCRLLVGLADFEKLWPIEGCAADEETVNVLLAGELRAVGALDGAAVQDAQLVCDGEADVVFDPLADETVYLLRSAAA